MYLASRETSTSITDITKSIYKHVGDIGSYEQGFPYK